MLTDECANLEHNQAVAVAGRGTLRPGRRVRFEKKSLGDSTGPLAGLA